MKSNKGPRIRLLESFCSPFTMGIWPMGHMPIACTLGPGYSWHKLHSGWFYYFTISIWPMWHMPMPISWGIHGTSNMVVLFWLSHNGHLTIHTLDLQMVCWYVMLARHWTRSKWDWAFDLWDTCLLPQGIQGTASQGIHCFSIIGCLVISPHTYCASNIAQAHCIC